MSEWLNLVILDNPVGRWAVASGVFLGVLVLLVAFRSVVGRRLASLASKTRTQWDDQLAEMVGSTKWFFFLVVSVYAASLMIEFPGAVPRLLHSAMIIALMVQALIWGNSLIGFWATEQKRKRLDVDAAAVTTANILSFIARVVLYAVVLLMVLDNVGIDVTALVASLGIGGLAVALAVQNVLADLFACLSISIDRPFVIGDFIIVDDLLGTVEHIGLKTTRVRSLSGEQLVFSNNDLLSSRIRNFKRMYERRVVFSFGVVYQTTHDQLTGIPGMVKEIIESKDNTRFDRAHFKGYGDSSLDFEIVYYVLVPDYNVYMDIQQSINLDLFERFEKQGVGFAYPTRTLYIERGDGGKTACSPLIK